MPFSWIWIIVFISGFAILYFLYLKFQKKRLHPEPLLQTQTAATSEELALIQSGVCGHLYDRDIFYRFLQNRHFFGLIEALFKASVNQSELECHKITAEIIRYQKHFKPSNILAEINKADQNKEFEKISALLRPYVQIKH